jgi:hypothetical protein
MRRIIRVPNKPLRALIKSFTIDVLRTPVIECITRSTTCHNETVKQWSKIYCFLEKSAFNQTRYSIKYDKKDPISHR